jgi:hypothetical protein
MRGTKYGTKFTTRADGATSLKQSSWFFFVFFVSFVFP